MCAFILIFSLSLSVTGCDNGTTSTGGGTPAHTHTWGAWKSDAAKHWKECTANDGAKNGEANHTGNPCTVCGYAEVEYTVAFVSFTPSTTLDFSPSLNTPLPTGVTYTVYCAELDRTYSGTGLTANINDGYSNFNTYTFTQTFKNSEGTVICSQVTKVDVMGGNFVSLMNTNNVQLDPQAIPPVTLKLPADLTITHTITVPAIATIANPLNFGAVSALSGWNSDFPSADVTYILTLDNVAQPAGTTSISANGLSDGQHTITQTFYYKGTAIPNGSRSAVGFVMGNNFAAMVTEGGFPELTLLLRKNAGVVTKTVSTTLDINPISFSIGTELNFTPTYSNVSNPSNFTTNDINNCLTYTITVVNYDGSYTNTWNSANGFDGKIPISDNYEGEFEFNNFTQTFYHNGQQVGSPRVLKVIAENSKFEYFGDDYGGTATIPAINGVSISRTVTE